MRLALAMVAVGIGCSGPVPTTGASASSDEVAASDANSDGAVEASDNGALGRTTTKKPCSLAAQCPAPTAACTVAACSMGWCTFESAANGTACNGVACGKGSCQSGVCSAENPYPLTIWPAVTAIVPRALCVPYGTPWLVGHAVLPGGVHQAWVGRNGASTLWHAGAMADLLACSDSGRVAVGWRRVTGAAESDGLVLRLGADGQVTDAAIATLPGDDAWTAVGGAGWSSAWIVGTRDGGATGIDPQWADADLDAIPPGHTAALAGDQYVRGVIDDQIDSAVLCGYQSVAGAPADAWFARVTAAGSVQWHVAFGGAGVQRIEACAMQKDGIAVGAGSSLVDSGQGPAARLWMVAVAVETGALLWQRDTGWPGGEGAELHSLSSAFPTGWLAGGFVRSGGVERPMVARFDEGGWTTALTMRGDETGRVVGVQQGGYPVQRWLGLHWSAPNTTAALARVSDLGKTECACSKPPVACAATPGCLLALCEEGEVGSKCWRKPKDILDGAPCPLPDGATGTCTIDGCQPIL